MPLPVLEAQYKDGFNPRKIRSCNFAVTIKASEQQAVEVSWIQSLARLLSCGQIEIRWLADTADGHGQTPNAAAL